MIIKPYLKKINLMNLYIFDEALDKIGKGWYQIFMIVALGAGYFVRL
jgi:hypothetical protein